jgi:hypothetical protein
VSLIPKLSKEEIERISLKCQQLALPRVTQLRKQPLLTRPRRDVSYFRVDEQVTGEDDPNYE